MNIAFTDEAWDDYTHWSVADRKLLKKINDLIKDIKRHPFTGIGKPEPLRYSDFNAWSRRIDREHRLVYVIKDDVIVIQQARFHY